MSKFLGTLFIVFMLTLGFATVAAAENTTLFAEYNMLSNDVMSTNIADINYLTIGGEYSNKLLLGASISSGINFDPDAPSDSSMIYALYAGYNFVNNDNGSFGVIAGYYNCKYEIFLGTYTENSILGLGFKGAFKAGPINFSLLYLYGLNNGVTYENTDYGDIPVVDVNGDWLQVNIGFMFNDSMGMYLNYNASTCKAEAGGSTVMKNELSGCGLGFMYRF